MSGHRKVHSHGSIPFSWEDKPGVCKTPNYECHANIGSFDPMNKKPPKTLPPPPPPPPPPRGIPATQDMKIPLPPCTSQATRRSSSGKGYRWEEDPFLVAYKKCTKSEGNEKLAAEKKNGFVGYSSKMRKAKSIFSCKNSSDAREDHFLKLSRLPSDHNNRLLTSREKQKIDLNYEAWL